MHSKDHVSSDMQFLLNIFIVSSEQSHLLSWSTFLIATISPESQSLAWYTTPKLPFPMTCTLCVLTLTIPGGHDHDLYLGVGVGHLRGPVRALARAGYHRHHLAPVLAWDLHPAKIVRATALLWIYEGCGARPAGHPENQKIIEIRRSPNSPEQGRHFSWSFRDTVVGEKQNSLYLASSLKMNLPE